MPSPKDMAEDFAKKIHGDLNNLPTKTGKESNKENKFEKFVRRTVELTLHTIFALLLLFFIALDILFFPLYETWSGPVIIGFFQLLAIIIAGRLCDIQEIENLVDKFFVSFGKNNNDDSKNHNDNKKAKP